MTRHFLVASLSVFLLAAVASAEEPKKPSPKPVPGADVFGNNKVWQFHLALSAEEYAAMQPAQGGGFGGFPGAPMPPKPAPKPGEVQRETHRSTFGTEFPWVIGSFSADGATIEKVGVRYKGNFTYMASSRNLKRSLKVDLNRHEDAGRFHGLKSLTLNCGVTDTSKGREALAYSVYRAAGVPAPRTAFAEVTLTVPKKYDKEHVGIYTLVESVDKTFLKTTFQTDKGLLLKPEGLRSLDYLGDDWAKYPAKYLPKRDATPEEGKHVIDFVKLVNLAPDRQFEKEISNYIDVDAFFKFMAATSLVSNMDSFFMMGHNYCIYLHPETKKFHFIPWDLDLSIASFPMFGSADQLMDLSLTKPYGAQCKLAERLMANKIFADRYQAILKELVPQCFDREKLLAEVATIEQTVKPLIEKETKAVAVRRENVGGGGFGPPGGFGGGPGGMGQPGTAGPALKTFVMKRSESVMEQLAGKRKGFTPASFGGPGFGGPGGGPGFGGPGGGFARPTPGEILPMNLQNALQLTPQQKKELAELQKKVDDSLEKMLTADQRAQLKRMREGGGPGFGGPGGFPGGGRGGPMPKN